MDEIIAELLAARDTAHVLHLRTRSFAAHLALNELYDALVDLVDSLTEMYQGKYGIITIGLKTSDYNFNDREAVGFIHELAAWAEEAKAKIPQDSFIQSEWDLVMAAIYKAKYKLENLV